MTDRYSYDRDRHGNRYDERDLDARRRHVGDYERHEDPYRYREGRQSRSSSLSDRQMQRDYAPHRQASRQSTEDAHRQYSRQSYQQPGNRQPYQQRSRQSVDQHARRQPASQRQQVADARRLAAAHNQQQRQRQTAPMRPLQGQYLGGAPQQRRGLPLPLIGAAIAVIAVVIGVVFILNPSSFKVTINGNEVTVDRDATLQSALDTEYASPNPGNLLAVDGSVITQGGGDAFSATINGEAVSDTSTKLAKDAVIEIGDGADVTESYTESEEAIPQGTASSNTDRETYWAGSLHVYSKGEDGVMSVKTGDVSGKTVKEQTKAAVPAGYNVYTANTGDDKVIALTFDDGPWPDSTKAILDTLEQNGAKATFFTIGNQVGEHTDQIKRAVGLGCEVCTHTWDHAAGSGEGVNLTYMSAEEQVSEITKGYKAIKDATGEEPPHIMRAPGGNYYGDLISTLAAYVDAEIGWDTDTEDWRRPGANKIYKRIMGTKSGQVVLMHDGGGDRTQTVEAVRKAVPELISKGYRLVTISELLAYGPPASSTSDSEQSSAASSEQPSAESSEQSSAESSEQAA